jgi:hypothetical protein
LFAYAFCDLGYDILLVFFLTLTKPFYFFPPWCCLHGNSDHVNGGRGDGGHHFLVWWSLVLFMALVVLFVALVVLFCWCFCDFGHTLLMVFFIALILFFY